MTPPFRCPVCFCVDPPFPPSAESPRETAKCRVCGSTSRGRAVAACVQDAIWGDPLARVWEMGWSPLSERLAEHPNVEYVRSELTARPGAVVQDLERTTWADAAFDVVICSDVLEHVRLYERALDELARVIAPGGTLVLTAPFAPDVALHRIWCIVDKQDSERDVWPGERPVHPDPCNPEGCPVFRYYGAALLAVELDHRGFAVTFTPDDRPEHGVVNCPVVLARR